MFVVCRLSFVWMALESLRKVCGGRELHRVHVWSLSLSLLLSLSLPLCLCTGIYVNRSTWVGWGWVRVVRSGVIRLG